MQGRTQAGKREQAALEKQRALFARIEPGSTVTAIEEVLSNPNLRSIRVGRRIVARVRRDTVTALGVSVGSEWSQSLASALEDALVRERAAVAAGRALDRRPLSRRELVTRLVRQGYEQDIAIRAADDAERAGLIDERVYAEAVIRSATHNRPAGRRLLESKLMARGIRREVACEAAAEAVKNRDAYQDAMDLAVKRGRSLPPSLDEQAATRRLVGFLARRGFDASVAFRAAREALSSRRGEGE